MVRGCGAGGRVAVGHLEARPEGLPHGVAHEAARLGLFQGLPRLWTYLHDITVYKDRAYLAYRDQGVIILDVSDATRPKMISQVKWSPPEQGNTHSIGVVVPKHGGRPDLLVVADEIFQCPYGYMHIIDVRYERNPVQIATFRLPVNRHCPPGTPQSDPRGIHDMDRMIRGDIVFSSWEASGFWAVDISLGSCHSR